MGGEGWLLQFSQATLYTPLNKVNTPWPSLCVQADVKIKPIGRVGCRMYVTRDPRGGGGGGGLCSLFVLSTAFGAFFFWVGAHSVLV